MITHGSCGGRNPKENPAFECRRGEGNTYNAISLPMPAGRDHVVLPPFTATDFWVTLAPVSVSNHRKSYVPPGRFFNPMCRRRARGRGRLRRRQRRARSVELHEIECAAAVQEIDPDFVAEFHVDVADDV